MTEPVFSMDMLAGLPPAELARRWCEGLTGSMVKYEVHFPDPDRFYGHCETRTIGSAVVATAQASAIKVSRRRCHIATDGQDRLFLLFNHNDGVLGSNQLGRSTTLHRGGATLLDLTEPFETFGKCGAAALALYVDRASVDRVAREHRRSHARVISWYLGFRTGLEACNLLPTST